MSENLNGLGVPIGVNDRDGNPIHIGDTLHFDDDEWGDGQCIFTVKIEKGEIVHPGSTSDLSEWCEIIKPWQQAVGIQGEEPAPRLIISLPPE